MGTEARVIRNGIGGSILKRNSGLDRVSRHPSRFPPQINQLHMTTRRATSRSATHSTAASSGQANSRRSSLNNGDTGDSFDGRPIKRQRLNTSSVTPALHASRSISPVIDGNNQDADIPDIITSLEEPSLDHLDNLSIIGDEEDSLDDEREYEEENDEPRRLSPLPRKRGRRPNIIRESTPTSSITDTLNPETPSRDDLDDLESDQDPQKAARRMPGRRRAPNSDPFLEACLRRQLQLRMGHRAVSKALKPILIELATRSAEQLEQQEDEELFWEVEQHMALELRSHLDARLEILENELRINGDYYDQRLSRDEEYWRTRFENHMASLRDDILLEGEAKVLELGRRYEHDLDEDATDDEMGAIVRPLHTRPSIQNPTGIMDSRHDSRSRFYLETEALGKVRDFRIHVGKQQGAALHDNNDRALEGEDDAIFIDPNARPKDFGGANEARRAKAAEMLAIFSLTSAAAELEAQDLRKLEQPKLIISNEDAYGLQTLAAALERRVHAGQQQAESSLVVQNLPTASPRVKKEQVSTEISAHLYPAAPLNDGGYYQHPELLERFHQTHAPYVPYDASGVRTSPQLSEKHSVRGHSRTISDTIAAINSLSPVQQHRRHRGYSLSGPYSNGTAFAHGVLDSKTSPSNKTEINSKLVSIPEAPRASRDHHTTSSAEPSNRPFWRSVLSDSDPRNDIGLFPRSSEHEAYRRRSETHMSPTDSQSYERKHSAPLQPSENNPFRSLRSPPQAQSQWHQHPSALAPPPPPPPQTPHGPPLYYAVPTYAVPMPYVVYAHPPAPPPHQQAGTAPPAPPHGPPVPPHGPPVFFGPPPPPQFGPPTGPQQQHYPWYRQ